MQFKNLLPSTVVQLFEHGDYYGCKPQIGKPITVEEYMKEIGAETLSELREAVEYMCDGASTVSMFTIVNGSIVLLH